MNSASTFFGAQREHSRVKTDLVVKYLHAWLGVMQRNARSQELAYVDLYAGTGEYEDGTPSTPIRVLHEIVQQPRLHTRMKTIFNDSDPRCIDLLKENVSRVSGIENLRHKPLVWNYKIDSHFPKIMGDGQFIPSLFFVDPWGYKGLTLQLLGRTIRSWGCDCIFFFNYNRINPAVSNYMVDDLINELFGYDRALQLRNLTRGKSALAREETILDALVAALKSVGGRYVLPFAIKGGGGKRTSHYIVYVGKHFRGYDIMKDVMWGMSSGEQGVRSLEFIPASTPGLQILLPFTRPYNESELIDRIVRMCCREDLRVDALHERVSVDTPYVRRDVKAALLAMESAGRLHFPPDHKKRRAGTMADDRVVRVMD